MQGVDQGAHQLGARAAQRVTQGDGATVDVQALRVGAQHLGPGHGHRGKGFVDFVQVDVVERQAGFFQRALRGGDGRLQHDDGVIAHHRHVVDAGQRLHAQRLQALFVDDHHAGRAVADLARRGGRQAAVFADELDARDGLDGGVHADAFVHRVHLAGARAVQHARFQRQDFALEAARFGGGLGALVAQQGKGVHFVFAEAVLLGDHFGADELAELGVVETLVHGLAHVVAQAFFGGQRGRRAHGHARHGLDATGDHDVHGARHDGLRGKVQGLLRRAALAVDRGARHRQRQVGRQHRIARDVDGLLARLAHAAPDHVFDQRRVCAGARQQLVDDLARQVGRVPAAQTTVATATSRAGCGDDVRFCCHVV